MSDHAVVAIGQDRPGIVAGVSEALERAGMGIEDSSMTILGGQFAMLLVVSGAASADELVSVLDSVRSRFSLTIDVSDAGVGVAATGPAAEYTIAAYGVDRPGLVAGLARVLADASVNVTDFGSRVTDGGTFAMWFNCSVPEEADVSQLGAQLADAGNALGLSVTMSPVEDEQF